MVVASAGVTDYELPKVVVASNLARIPDAVKKELNKVRPRLGDRAGVGVSTQSVDAPEKPKLVCPEGYLLVEFFDMHDFGWAKAESVVLLNGNGKNKIAEVTDSLRD